MELQGKTAVVTGGGSGIGAAIVRKLAAAGAAVFGGDIDEASGEAVAAEARDGGGQAESRRLDVTDHDSIKAFAAWVLERAPRVDVVINGAGGGDIRPFMKTDQASWLRVTALNFLGPVGIAHAFLPSMADAGRGKIVNVSSDAGRVGSAGETVYAGAKGGLIAFTKSLAREVARFNINVNCVCPGPTDTPLLRSRPEKMLEALNRAIPFGRPARPDEIADAVAFFAGPGSDYITGQVLSVSGGLTMVD